jgi:hypothetical protein
VCALDKKPFFSSKINIFIIFMQNRCLLFYLISTFVAVQIGKKQFAPLDSAKKDESKSAFLFQSFPINESVNYKNK